MEENAVIGFMSQEINEISSALSAFQGEIEQPKLNKENPFFKSRYVDLSGVLKAAQPVLSKHGLAVSQLLMGSNLITILTHKSGQWLRSECPLGNYKSQQDRGSAITYTKRYAICAMLGMAADMDDDGNSATEADKIKADPKARIRQAVAEMNSVQNYSQWQEAWLKWTNEDSSLSQPGTPFYNAAGQKRQTLQDAPK